MIAIVAARYASRGVTPEARAGRLALGLVPLLPLGVAFMWISAVGTQKVCLTGFIDEFAAGMLLAIALERWPTVSVRTSLFSAALLPTTLSRADDMHIVPGSIVSLALLPALVMTLVRRLKATPPSGIVGLSGYVSAFALSAACVAVFFGADRRAPRSGACLAAHTYSITVGRRSFSVADPFEARDVQAIVGAADRLAKPGESLFVGPADLRRTNYNDTYVYYLLPQHNRLVPHGDDPRRRNGSGLIFPRLMVIAFVLTLATC